MGMRRRSRWHDDGDWRRRLERDRELIDARLDDEQKKVLFEVPRLVDEKWRVRFVLVVGSRARGDHRDNSDVDIYIEAEGAPNDAREAPVVPHPRFNVLIVPGGTILANVRAGEAYATAYAREGLVAQDDGSFRDALVALEEEGRLD
jgi:Nucleotidyltransferase domain